MSRLRYVLWCVLLCGILAMIIGAAAKVAFLRKRELTAPTPALIYQASAAQQRHEIAALRREIETLKRDIDVCHLRADDLWMAIDAVAKTVPWRARPPLLPKRVRPGRKLEAEQ